MPTPQPIRSLLGASDSSMQRLLSRANSLGKYNAALQTLLPNTLKNKVFLLNLSEETAVLGCQNSALLSSLRFQLESLLKLLQNVPGLQHIRAIRFKIIAPQPGSGKSLPPATMSSDAGQLLHQAAEAFDDPDLKAAFQRLAERARDAEDSD